MKLTQWFAFGLVLLLVAEILLVPEEAQAWGRRRRRWSSRRRRWLARRRRWSSRRRWIRKVGRAFRRVGRAIVRGVKKVGRVIHKAVVSKVGGYIIGGISLVNGFVGNACCTGGLATGPIGAGCCVVTRGIAGAACGLNTYRAAHFAKTGRKGEAALAAAGAGGACFQAATGVTAFKAGWDAYKAGRRRRAVEATPTTSKEIAPCGKEHLAKDLGRLKMMICSMMDLRSNCKHHTSNSTQKIVQNMTNTIAGVRLFLTLSSTVYKNTGVMEALSQTRCKDVFFLPYCHHTKGEVSKVRESVMKGRKLGYDTALSVCRHSLPGERRITEKICRTRMTYAMLELGKMLSQLTNDVAAMHKSEFGANAVERTQKEIVKTMKKATPSTG